MRDDQLLQDLEAVPGTRGEKYKWLAKHGITSYSQLLAFIEDKTNDPDLRFDACYIIHRLWKVVDKRRAVPPLLAALNANDEKVRGAAANTLGMLKSRRAVLPLMEILRDPLQPISVRHWAIDGLNLIGDESAIPLFCQIIDDPKEHIEIRSRAIEMLFEKPEPLDKFIALLSDPLPDIRFWAAYRLSFISPPTALPELDRIVANDHTLPIGWGWHVDREAMLPLETIYYRKILGLYHNNEAEEYPWYGHGPIYLISPAPEYDTLSHEYRQRQENLSYITNPAPEISLSVDSEWLAKQLRIKWLNIELNVRQPRPKAYLLDWHLQLGEKHLIGALHRDQYAVVLTGDDELVYSFSAWYRGLFPAEQQLLFYEWADYGVDMPLGMSAKELDQAIRQRHEQRRNWTPPLNSDSTQAEIT